LAQLVEFIANHYILVAIFVLLLVALAFSETKRAGAAVNTLELTRLVNSDLGKILDIRIHKEFTAGHIAGSLNIPQDKLTARLSELDKFKDKTIIVVDANGANVSSICTELLQAGFKAVKLVGGISTWRAENLPLVKKD